MWRFISFLVNIPCNILYIDSSAMSFRVNQRTRIAENDGYLQARTLRSTTPYSYTVSEGLQAGCTIIPDAHDYMQCNKTWANTDNDASNYLRFGEDFSTYEPGHAVSMVLQQHSFYAGRGEGIVARNLVDVESSLKLPPKPDAQDIRGRERLREIDETPRKFPPNMGPRVPRGCSRIYERVVVEAGGPRGGRSTRCDVRNAALTSSPLVL